MPDALLQRTRHVTVALILPVLCAAALALGLTVPAVAVRLLADTQPVIMTGTFTSRPGQQYVDMAMNQYLVPTHVCDPGPCTYATPYPLTTPEQAWPITGLFDHTFGRSVQIGLGDLETEIASVRSADPDQPIVIFGYSQSAVISTEFKRRLAAEYPAGDPAAPDISFVLIGNLNRPNGGVMTRFQGAYIPFINFYFNGPAPTNTDFTTVDIARQYDGFADFPLYPLNVVSTANALLGILYVHTDYQATTLAPTPPAAALQGTFDDTTYYLIPTEDLPLLQPLRDLGAPEPLMALVEPTLRVVVELGYDRSIGPWVPTRARLFAPIDLAAVADDLGQAWQQGIDDAVAEIVNPTPPTPGPTPTERVVTDLVRLNVSHTIGALVGGDTEPAAETSAETVEPLAESSVDGSADAAGDVAVDGDRDSDDESPRGPRQRRPLGSALRDVVTSVRDRLTGERDDSGAADADDSESSDDAPESSDDDTDAQE